MHNHEVNILYITNNYINIVKCYDIKYDDCLLVFPNKNDIYFFYSYYKSGTYGYYRDEIEYHEYAFTLGQLLFSQKSFFVYSEIENEEVYLLLSWHNKKINLYYIILYKCQDIVNIYV